MVDSNESPGRPGRGTYVKIKSLGGVNMVKHGKIKQTLRGSFSAVSKPNFASEYYILVGKISPRSSRCTRMESPDEKKWLKRRKWKDRTKAGKNNGDNNKGDAHVTPLLGNSPAAKRTESTTAPLFWRTAEPSKLAGDEGELVPSYPNPVT